ncbi:DUF4335 domain-containing protein [Prochlorococcus marinus]|uniref:Uncharacterized protein n=1 Tax=Prochlorococcus marinus (strain MIT 9211) TaxID=93059 RepID=A9BAK0_PROM4|nr:DUF4335 domain-containing protein [Prochlorococcus marinus]ABX08862.1 conserved hypothetical protein [Prochlorococcus marinus str. MIT 9211]
MKQNYRYDQASARLELEGIADASLGLSIDTISILLLWRLKLIGGPELEGKKEHLQCFMNSVLQYSRYRLSGIKKKIGKQGDFVTISPNNSSGHLLVLTSTKEGVSPVEIVIDDAELTDLTRCFDQLRTDSRVLINWDIPKEKGLNASELISSKLLLRFFSAPIVAVISLVISSTSFLLIPELQHQNSQYENVKSGTNYIKK